MGTTSGDPKLYESLKSCLASTYTIESDHEKIIETAERVTRGLTGEVEKIVKLFYFVRDSIPYSMYMISVFKDDFRASKILEWGKGYCVQKAVLLTALGRASGIPSRLAFAKIKNYRVPPHVVQELKGNTFPRHGYNQFFLNGQWINATPTFNKDLCEKNGLPTVEFDGKKDAILPEKDLKGRPYIEYVEKFSPKDDLPFEWIRKEISKIVGPDKHSWPEKQARMLMP